MTDKVISQECNSPDDCVFDSPLPGAHCVFCGRKVCTSIVPGKRAIISQQSARALLEVAKDVAKAHIYPFPAIANALERLNTAIAACEKGEGDNDRQVQGARGHAGKRCAI